MRARILDGRLAIGSALREKELCELLGISRIPVREALSRLEAEGLVVLRPNRGAVVAEISPAEVDEIGEACKLLECHVLKKALACLDVEILDEAEACLDRLEATDDAAAWSRINWEFHTTLYRCANRPLLLDLLNSLRARAERAMLILVADRGRRKRLDGEHRELLRLLRSGRGKRAVALLDSHLEGGRDSILRLL